METTTTNVKFRFELTNKPNREGHKEVFLVVTDSGERTRIKTDVLVKDAHFGIFKDVLTAQGKKVNKRVLTPGAWVTKKDDDAEYKNKQLQKKINEYKKTLDAKKEEDNYVTAESVIKAVASKYICKDVVSVFDRKIMELAKADDYPNQKGYVTTRGNLVNFLEKEEGVDKVDFRHIDKQFLTRFEKYLFKTINGGECSDASVHTQIKRLRAIFNYAISEQIITPDCYPFKAYKMPKVTRKHKERLTEEELAQFEKVKYEKGTLIFHAQKIFMLAVRMAGARIEDMLTLRVKNVSGGRITYNMKKGNTGGTLQSIKITDKIQAILDCYITKNSKPEDLIFPFLAPAIDKFSNTQYKREVGNKTSHINYLLKKIADDACISKKVTTHISRHSFASVAQKKTKNVKVVQELLGHTDVKITLRYLEELNLEAQDEEMDKIAI